jgi:hypothetical protein
MSRRVKIFLLCVAAIVGVVILLDRIIVTDKEAIEAVIEECGDASVRKDSGKIMSFVSPDYQFGGQSRDDIAKLVSDALVTYDMEKITFQRKDITVEGDKATAYISVMIKLRRDVMGYGVLPFSFRVSFARHGKSWLITEFEAGAQR